MNFQMSGDVSDESAQSIGKFLAADLVITGQLRHLGSTYRFTTNAIRVETAIHESIPRFTVRNDQDIQSMITALNRQTTITRTAKYAVTEQTIPQTAGTYIDRGILFVRQGEYERAIEDFNEVIGMNPNMTAAYLLRGRALVASIPQITANFEVINEAFFYYTNREVSTEQAQVYEQAIADFNNALKIDQKNAIIYWERGNIYLDKGNFTQAIMDYTHAIKLNPNLATVYNSRGIAYRFIGNNDRAFADFDQAIRLNPDFETAYYNRGIMYHIKRDYNRAVLDFTQVIQLNPNFALAYIRRGILSGNYQNRMDFTQAIRLLDQVIKLYPNDAEAYNSRGIAYFELGFNSRPHDNARAISDFNQAIRLEPNHVELYLNRGFAHYFKIDHETRLAGDFDNAIAQILLNVYS